MSRKDVLEDADVCIDLGDDPYQDRDAALARMIEKRVTTA